jgi:pilus assembly protein Flp/PilA
VDRHSTPADTADPIRRSRLLGKEVGIVLVQYILSLFDREEGQGLAEYALILALIAIVAIVALIFLGGQISGILNTVGTSI